MRSPAPTAATLPHSELALFSQECSPKCQRMSSTQHFAWLVHIVSAIIVTLWVSLSDRAEGTSASHQSGRAACAHDSEDSCRSRRMPETKCSVSD